MPNELLRTAQYLTERPGGSTSHDLCASVSTAYYALFEALAKLSADLFVGNSGPDRAERAWSHVYRSLEHTRVATKCSSGHLNRFPQEIIDFAELFLQLQYKRQQSDYEYGHAPNIGEVRTDIQRAEVQIQKLLAFEEKHLRAFCVYILFDKHRHEEKQKFAAGRTPNIRN